jgi:uncharacterized protein YecE (DUF72 family)
VEVRDERWLGSDLDDVLASHGATRVHHDLLRDDPTPGATFEYWRFHGPDPARPYHGHYDRHRLRTAAQAVAESLRHGVDVEAYFNNDVDGAAPRDALRFRDLVLDELGIGEGGEDTEDAAAEPVAQGS